MDAVLVVTGVWFAVFDPRDQYHAAGLEKAGLFEVLRIVVPWPTMYETLGTHFVKNPRAMGGFERILKSPTVEFIDDDPFREDALELAFESSLRGRRPLSMVDCLIRLLLDDVDTGVDYLATFNVRDFADVCARRDVEII